jgi:hypothetical protein
MIVTITTLMETGMVIESELDKTRTVQMKTG